MDYHINIQNDSSNKTMRIFNKLIYCTVFIMMTNLSGQDLEDLDFGTDSTFEILTWNIEWFPKNGQTTVDYVTDIIQALDADLFAIQEVDNTNMFDQMLDELTQYEGYYESAWFAGLAYIYKTDVIEINDIYEIYTTSPYWSPFPRSPMVMDMSFMGENIIIINNHFKCCGDGYLDIDDSGDEETRRYIASNLLKEYVDTNFQNDNVIILGDLNDILTDNIENNVFQMILDDSDNYHFADMDIAQGSSFDWSYPTWPSHIDHILITNELFDELENTSSDIQTIKIDEYIDGGWSEYDQNVSDHRPVALKLLFNQNLIIEYTEGWNMVGLPVNTEDNDYQIQFPDAVEGTLFGYNGFYEEETFLENGRGYWLKIEGNSANVFIGEPIQELEIGLNEGWNMVTGLTSPLQIINIIDEENIIVEGTLYGFSGGYDLVDVLLPGKGYWLKANTSGIIILSSQ